jgi:branched-chain amino acid aminotransferase
VFKLKEHIDRLFYSAKAILLEIPMSHAELMKATSKPCRANKLRDGYIRLVVTRGVGTLGLNPRSCKNRPSSSSPAKSRFIRRNFTRAAWTS